MTILLPGDPVPADAFVRPSMRAHRTTTLALPSGSIVPITFDTEDFDIPGGIFTAGGSIITLPIAGLWGVAVYGGTAINAVGFRRFLIEQGTSGVYPIIDQRPAVTADNTHVTATGTYKAAAGDTLRIDANQNSGGSVNLLIGATVSVWLIQELI